jgi:hypothetical protein
LLRQAAKKAGAIRDLGADYVRGGYRQLCQRDRVTSAHIRVAAPRLLVELRMILCTRFGVLGCGCEAVLEAGVAELVDGAGLAEHASLVGVFEEPVEP